MSEDERIMKNFYDFNSFQILLKDMILKPDQYKYYAYNFDTNGRLLQVSIENIERNYDGLMIDNDTEKVAIDLYIIPRDINKINEELLLLYIILPKIIESIKIQLIIKLLYSIDTKCFVRIKFQIIDKDNIHITISRLLEYNGKVQSKDEIIINSIDLIFKQFMDSLINFYNDNNNFIDTDKFTFNKDQDLKDLLTYFNICKKCSNKLNQEGQCIHEKCLYFTICQKCSNKLNKEKDCDNVECDKYTMLAGGARLKSKRKKSRNKSRKKSRRKSRKKK